MGTFFVLPPPNQKENERAFTWTGYCYGWAVDIHCYVEHH